jgi:hypothetical protein
MKKLFFLFVGLFVLSVRASFAQEVHYNFDKDTDFLRFKTYKWVNIKEADRVDGITEKQIMAAFDAELAKKGLTRTDSDSADLYLAYQTAIETEKKFHYYQTGWGTGQGWGDGWFYGDPDITTAESTTTIYVGQLTLDIYEASKKELVWRGVVSKTLDLKAKPDEREKNIEKAVEKLLKNYPPKVRK